MEVMNVGREREGERARVPGFEEFLLAHGKALLRLAYVITGSRYDADDLLQDTLVDLHRSWSRVEQAAAPYAYARRALVNRHTSNRRRRSATELPVAPEALPQFPIDGGQDRVAEDEALWRRLATLPPRMRQVLVLRYFEDLSDAEIADVLGIGVSAVRSSASRAIGILREGELS